MVANKRIVSGWTLLLTAAVTVGLLSACADKSIGDAIAAGGHNGRGSFTDTYTITFNANGGSVTPASGATNTSGYLTSLPVPARSGYTFDGWYTSSSGGTRVTTSYRFNGNTVIYAHWTQNSTVGGNNVSVTVNGYRFEMVPVAGGTFTMGCTGEQGSDCYDVEKPAHSVTLSSYYIGKYEVTQGLWRAVMGSSNNPSYFKKGDNYPVENVSWNTIVNEFIPALNRLTGKTYRLPTEAEWEYAARGGNKSGGYKYSGSNTLGSVGWYWDNIPSQSSGNSGYGTQPVGGKNPNELGIYDMSGNVWEWVSDWYNYYSSSPTNNPTGPTSGSYRVFRGGSWISGARNCRVSFRSGYPGYSDFDIGLRLVLLSP
ncbi:hypothetical protein R80B4_02326 [Fibrobacteres bacterium R8-0-B4]